MPKKSKCTDAIVTHFLMSGYGTISYSEELFYKPIQARSDRWPLIKTVCANACACSQSDRCDRAVKYSRK